MSCVFRIYAYLISVFCVFSPTLTDPLLWFDETKTYEEIAASVREHYRLHGSLSQSDTDLLEGISTYVYQSFCDYFSTEQKKALLEALLHERTVNEDGGLVFYHATKPECYALHYIDTHVRVLHERYVQQRADIAFPKMLVLRQSIPNDPDPTATLQKYKNPPMDKYNEVEGMKYDQNPEAYRVLLSCNGSLFGNGRRYGASSFVYWVNKFNCAEIAWDYDMWSSQYTALHHTLQKQKDKFLALVQEFAQKCTTGVLLQLCFTDPELLDQTSYISQYYGYGYGPVHTGGGSIINTTTQVLSRLAKGQFFGDYASLINELEYRLILTQDLLLNPFNSRVAEYFSIKAYVANKQLLDEFHTQIDAVIAEIEKELVQGTSNL